MSSSRSAPAMSDAPLNPPAALGARRRSGHRGLWSPAGGDLADGRQCALDVLAVDVFVRDAANGSRSHGVNLHLASPAAVDEAAGTVRPLDLDDDDVGRHAVDVDPETGQLPEPL